MGPRVRFEGISKRYGSVAALDGVTFECGPGEIRAVVGENGAGKSTLMGVLGGFVRPDSGSVQFEPSTARIAMVHQHFMLVPEFSVEDNLALGALRGAGPILRSSELSDPALQKGRDLGWEFDPKAKTSRLSVGQQQRLEVLKALATGAEVLILDEPTAVLRPEEVEELFRVLRGLRDEGRTLLFVAHKLDEVLAISDRIAVLRGGKLVADVPRAEADAERLAQWMLGETPPSPERPDRPQGAVRLRAKNLGVRGDRGEIRVDSVSFDVREGEILGISGVEGNGQTELAEALAGVRPSASGELEIESERVGFVPPDRHRDGLALDMSVEENLLIEGWRNPDLRTGLLMKPGAVEAWAEGLRNRYEVATPNVQTTVRNLSGGNQQKVVVARALDAEPGVLVAVNPTRGLDVRASAFVRSQMAEAAKRGAAVVLFSTDRDELDEIATRQLFMNGGRLFDSEAAALSGAKR